MRKILGKVIIDKDEYDVLMGKMKDLGDTCTKLKNHRADDRTITILREDLGNSVRRIEELKSELSKCRDEAERYKEEALRQIVEKKALYERVKR